MLKISKNEVQFITQQQIADYIGVSKQFINMIFKGRRPMPARYRRRIEKKFRIPSNYWDTRQAA